ncbi:hypothetical protein [Nocardia sp. NPDC006630]|uniref:hypothetical protein n=1 Tax=Nocardia sp. NPDC006630 TaxID=3157181 RepID=UPI0033A73274
MAPARQHGVVVTRGIQDTSRRCCWYLPDIDQSIRLERTTPQPIYPVRIGYFIDYLVGNELPTTTTLAITREHLGALVESLLKRPNRHKANHSRRGTHHGQYRS